VRSRSVKLALATALAIPVVGVLGMPSAHAWDCDQAYGAITRHPSCDRVGIPFGHHHHGDHDGDQDGWHDGDHDGDWGGGGPVQLR
jgi:hypothetical protein